MTMISFTKMHGAGNDFIIIDRRQQAFMPTKTQLRQLAARRFGIGCDQLLLLDEAANADIAMSIYNADGGEVDTCGNALRCVGWRIMQETGKDEASVHTNAGRIMVKKISDHQVQVDMGAPKLDWQDIPLAEQRNPLHLGVEEGRLMNPAAVNMGNPHMVFFVNHLERIDIDQLGPKLECHALFPQRANVSAVQVVEKGHIKQIVWERGAGQTLACGSAACAAVVAGVQRGLCNRECTVELPGGLLHIIWDQATNHVLMTGPVAEVFSGQVPMEALEAKAA